MNKKLLENEALELLKSGFIAKQPALELYQKVIKNLEDGTIRVAEKIDNTWVTNGWIKEVILLGFKHGELINIQQTYYDKDTMLPRKFSLADKIRMVPGGSAVRSGSYIAPGTIIMPPAYINIGAYVDSGVMIDSHALVGSCAQIGKNVHLSAATQIGGVLEPIGANPVIIEDNVFIGGNCGIYEGVIVEEHAVIASGVILNNSLQLFDNINNRFIKKESGKTLVVPKGAVVVPGTRPISQGPGKEHQIQLYCPVIIKYRDAKTSAVTTLEEILR